MYMKCFLSHVKCEICHNNHVKFVHHCNHVKFVVHHYNHVDFVIRHCKYPKLVIVTEMVLKYNLRATISCEVIILLYVLFLFYNHLYIYN